MQSTHLNITEGEEIEERLVKIEKPNTKNKVKKQRMNSESFANILRPLPFKFNLNLFINAFDRYIVYLSKEQLEAYSSFIDRKSNWNELYMKLFPNQPFPKDYDKFVDYKEKRKKRRQWFVASLF